MTVLDVHPSDALRRIWGTRGSDRIHLAGDPGYDAARIAWNLAVDQRPAAVAQPQTVDEVSALVRAAAVTGLRVAPQSTGHNAGPLAERGLDDVVVLRTGGLNQVRVDAARGVVRVEGGAVWEPVVEAAAAHGCAVLHGSSPDVGVAGFTLGGGIGWYARKLGLAANSLVAAEVVIGDGSLVRADAEQNAPLFWALRGGGGSFGVVVALEFRMFPIASAYAGMMVWDLADAERVLREYAAWAPTAPDEVSASFRAMRLPPIPDIPEPLRGRRIAVLDGAVLGSDERAAEILAGFRSLRPEIDTFGRVPTTAVTRIHMDPEGGAPFASSSTVLEALPDAGIDAFWAEVGPDATTSLLLAELRQLGGAVGRPAKGGGVLSHLEGQYAVFAGGMAMTPQMGAQAHADAVKVTDALAPHATGTRYLNFTENAVDSRTAYGEERWLQLKGIRSAVDQHGAFAANHPVPRLYENGQPTA
ncbi:FAD-binding oxidoreductase [Nocardioides sp. Iso805N]|uniref:FAD-binding oxidoreductase n=1 Tax=Nocardioides sp. Iso805N TaxID=1283287 RepID=UPI00037F9B93|nr:FAD-binding oxidoreductase [Nocardioides sp. Iso805N]